MNLVEERKEEEEELYVTGNTPLTRMRGTAEERRV
jgi:hypothetical protein